jgi:uncharacterized protein YdiU (UPF0061 family)
MSIIGLTIDYGPFGFIDHFDLDHICNHSDHEGRYSFGNQPSIGMWNLEQLGIALDKFISKEDRDRTLASYPQIFHVEYRGLLKKKCGLVESDPNDEDFMRTLLLFLVDSRIDYTLFFRALCHYQTEKKLPFESSVAVKNFLVLYDERLKRESTTPENRREQMLAVNPKFILRNYIAQVAIDNFEKNPQILDNIFRVLSSPFDEWIEFSEYANPAPPQYKNLSVSCSS